MVLKDSPDVFIETSVEHILWQTPELRWRTRKTHSSALISLSVARGAISRDGRLPECGQGCRVADEKAHVGDVAVCGMVRDSVPEEGIRAPRPEDGRKLAELGAGLPT